MVKILVRGRRKDLKVKPSQAVIVTRDQQSTVNKIRRENKYKVDSIASGGKGVYIFKLSKKKKTI